MKIFTAEQIYLADKSTIENQRISSTQLMERAATGIFDWIHRRMQGAQVKIHLFCGIGNNGGDGIAVARHLQDHGYNIGVYVVNYSKKRSEDFLINLERLKERKVWPVFLEERSDLPIIGRDDIIIDAIFGIGLNRKPDKWVGRLMRHLNDSDAFILSIDVPSGLFLDKGVADSEAVIRANYVLSFQAPKLIFFLPGTGVFVDNWEVLDIGLDSNFMVSTETAYELIGKKEVLPLYIPREKFAHKGSYGHSLIIGGSYGKIGAITLASKACLKAGSGLVSTYLPHCGYIPLQTFLPENMVITDKGEKYIEHIDFEIEPNAIGIGVGLGTSKKTVKAFSDFLSKNTRPLVIDADGLNILSKNRELIEKIPPQTVLTPHPKELERLIGNWKDDFDKLAKAKTFSKEYDCILVIKGAHTITIYKDKGYINTTGNPGMATAGSGDALTGILTGLVAQGYTPLSATILGIYLHGRAGDIAIEKMGYQALTASDITAHIGKAYLDLFITPERTSEQASKENES
ncbi:NAD(P)H-hydrate dehydratase [Ulvibacterium sp.]|uniref:NAD(P)H-hydrate dehydratase n=1 Tax=Ulvibacterium sp. TaxID=2665914 RepID=UPI002603202A|nr:NAD(P)H-hydrate dehydratase [Ulvibacterium sp.]